MKFVQKVGSKNVGLNPVARAFAVQKMREKSLSHQISMMMLEEGEYAASEAIAQSFIVYALLACLQEMGETDSVDYRKLKSAAVVLEELAKRGFTWRRADAITLDNSMEICINRWAKIDPILLNKHINRLQEIDREVLSEAGQ